MINYYKILIRSLFDELMLLGYRLVTKKKKKENVFLFAQTITLLKFKCLFDDLILTMFIQMA